MSIIKRPIITEKTAAYLERGLQKYGFEVDMAADKFDIKQEVERLYEVEVESVNTLIVRGKTKMRYSKKGIVSGKRPNYKKAVITLKPGFEIDFYKHI